MPVTPARSRPATASSRGPRPRRHGPVAARSPRHRASTATATRRWRTSWPTGSTASPSTIAATATPAARGPATAPSTGSATATTPRRWRDLAVRRATGGPIVAFGHSMGGACLLMAAHRDPSLFRRLVLFEPIVFPRPTGPPAGRRQNSLVGRCTPAPRDVPAATRPRSTTTRPSRRWRRSPQPRCEAYVRYGFAPGDDGQVHLKCRPRDRGRARSSTSWHHGTWDVLARDRHRRCWSSPASSAEMQPSTIAAGIAERLPNGPYVQRDDLDHFGPMTHPRARRRRSSPTSWLVRRA